MKGRGALELGTLSCLMICFTAANKFKNMHQHLTDQESVHANARALPFTLGWSPGTEQNRRWERIVEQRPQCERCEGPA